jgi:hypothetical protein
MSGGSPRTVVGWWSWRDNTMHATKRRIVCHHHRQTHRLSRIVFGQANTQARIKRIDMR